MSKKKQYPCINLLDIHMICTLSHFYMGHCTRLPQQVVTKHYNSITQRVEVTVPGVNKLGEKTHNNL